MEWKEVRLGEIASELSDGLHAAPQFVNGGDYIFVNAKNLKDGWIVDNDPTKKTTYEEFLKYRSPLNENTLLYSIDGTIGNIARYRGEKCVLGKGACYINPKSDIIDSDYLYYQLQSPHFRSYIDLMSTGSTIKHISLKTMRNYVFDLPSLEDQRRIANILSSLDRKIELNNKINAQLEEMAQTLFKHWFVDFGPFKDGKFVESELGMIPEGWNIVSLDDLTSKFGTGLNPRKNFVLGKGENYYVTIKNLSDNRVYLDEKCDRVNDEALALINKRSKLMKGDLLFSGVATVGRVALVVDEPKNWHTGETIFNMHPQGVSSEFLYILLLSKLFQEYVKVNLYGSSQQCISMASLKAYKIALPNNDVLKEFDSIIIPIIRKIKSIDKENDSLAKSRDTLLPKLMSGEINLEDYGGE